LIGGIANIRSAPLRAKPPSLISHPWQTTHGLRYADADMNGHINNGLFGSLMETNRSMLFMHMREAETGQPVTSKVHDNATTVIARFEIDYLKELHFPGEVTAACGVERIGGASFVLRQCLYSHGICAAVARSTIVMMDVTTRKATPIADGLRQQLNRWLITDGPA